MNLGSNPYHITQQRQKCRAADHEWMTITRDDAEDPHALECSVCGRTLMLKTRTIVASNR